MNRLRSIADVINEAASKGFTTGADAYVAARPGYPAALYELLSDRLGVGPDTRVCDLAAGTGKFTVGLVDLGAQVVAVEPVAAMRDRLHDAVPGVEVLDGTAETIPLADSAMDVVTVAQAFHWFDPVAALAEIRRVLRPEGLLVVAWNVRDESVDWVHTFTEMIVEGAGGRPYTPYHGFDAEPGEIDERFRVATEHGFGPITAATFDNPQPTTPALVVERAASTSFVGALEPTARGQLLDRVRELVATHPQTAGRTSFVFPHRTELFWCHSI